MTELLYTLAGAVIPAIIFGAWRAGVRIAHQLADTTPERRKTDRLESRLEHHGKVLDALLVTQGPTLDGVIALLEVTKGQCNGNVDRALDRARDARDGFGEFLVDGHKSGGAA